MKTSCLAILILLAMSIASCKKNEDNTIIPANSILGYWSGIGVDNTLTAVPLGFLFKSNGTARAYAGNADTSLADKANATYSIDADSVRMIVTFGSDITQFNAMPDSVLKHMSGTFRRTTNDYHGTYSITKQ